MHHHGDGPYAMGHSGLSGDHAEHMAALDLVAPADATHMAVQSGDWFDPATWGGAVPGDGARVIIPHGLSVDYGAESAARIHTIGVGGELRFATDRDSALTVDTIVVAPGGRLEAGTADSPVPASVSIAITIANNGDIDTVWDPQLLSRGIVSLGEVEMHGAEKTVHLKAGTDPMAGDTVLTLDAAPEGWQIGDTIVIAGTEFPGWGWDNSIRQSIYRGDTHEVRTITAINGAMVTLDRPLEHDHGSPRVDLKTSVANYSRSITIASEDGADSAIHHRGHVMFMGSDDVDVRYVAFDELGRTDKSERSVPATDLGIVSPDSNVQGRYSAHLHRLGTEDPESPAILEGNAVIGSPGWGIAHHSSNALLHRNATFDVFGSGFVAEKGDEIGTWSENISIGTEGVNRLEKDAADVAAFDLARTGSGFWFQGRMVEAIDNVAAGASTGFVWMTRGASNGVDPLLFDQPEALGLGGLAFPNHPTINGFRGNETFGSERGLVVIKANPNQGHDLRTVMEDFTAWEVRTGVHLEYTSHYTLRNFDLTAIETAIPYTSPGTGIEVGTNTSDVVIVDARIAGFEHGYELSGVFTFPTTVSQNQYVIVGGEHVGITGSLFEGDALTSGRVEVLESATERTPEVAISPSVIGYSVPERSAIFTGAKTDSLGAIPIPAGTDTYRLGYDDVRTILETDGYFDRNGTHVFVAEAYYQDRLTGEIVKEGHIVEGVSTDIFSNPYGLFRDAVFNGAFPEGNRAPEVEGEAISVAFETPLTVDVLANDSDPDGHAIRVDGLVQPRGGKVFDQGDGTIRYVPDLDFTGEDGFFYWVTDGYGAFSKAEVRVVVGDAAPQPDPQPDPEPEPDPVPVPDPDPDPVPDPEPEPEPDPEPVNRAPEAGDITLDAISGAQVFTAEALLAESSDPDGDPISILSLAGVTGGIASLTSGGAVSFLPDAETHGAGAAGFTMLIGDGRGGEDSARVTLDLPEPPPPPPPTPPMAGDDTATVGEDDAGIAINVRANDADGDAAARIARIEGVEAEIGVAVPLASGAAVVLTPDGRLNYAPSGAFEALDAGETATDSFDYTLESAAGQSTATVTVTVLGADEAPDTTPDPEPDPIPDPDPDPVPDPDPLPGPEVIGESGILTIFQQDPDAWLRVDFAERLENPSVVIGPLTANGGDPVTLRLREVTETGFEVQVDEWAYLDGWHIEETLSWLAVEAGTHRLADGRVLEAGRSDSASGWSETGLDAGFGSTPIVLGQVSSARDPEAVVLRLEDVGATGFSHRLQEAEAADDAHLTELVSWIAVEAGTGSLEAGWTDRGVNHRRTAIEFEQEFDAMPAFLAGMQETRGGNTATVRQVGGLWDADGAMIRIEEEQSADREIWHIREDVGYLAVEPGLLFGEVV